MYILIQEATLCHLSSDEYEFRVQRLLYPAAFNQSTHERHS